MRAEGGGVKPAHATGNTIAAARLNRVCRPARKRRRCRNATHARAIFSLEVACEGHEKGAAAAGKRIARAGARSKGSGEPESQTRTGVSFRETRAQNPHQYDTKKKKMAGGKLGEAWDPRKKAAMKDSKFVGTGTNIQIWGARAPPTAAGTGPFSPACGEPCHQWTCGQSASCGPWTGVESGKPRINRNGKWLW